MTLKTMTQHCVTQHNAIQHYSTQHNDTKLNETQHNGTQYNGRVAFSYRNAECHYVECRSSDFQGAPNTGLIYRAINSGN
jgi:hypothetical protein